MRSRTKCLNEIIDRLLNVSCPVVDLKKFFISLSFENDLSSLATDTGKVSKIHKVMEVLGEDKLKYLVGFSGRYYKALLSFLINHKDLKH